MKAHNKKIFTPPFINNSFHIHLTPFHTMWKSLPSILLPTDFSIFLRKN